jgi:hypothetical protein
MVSIAAKRRRSLTEIGGIAAKGSISRKEREAEIVLVKLQRRGGAPPGKRAA